MKRLRIGLVIPTMDRGGAEKQLALLAASLPNDQFEVHVILLTRDGPRSQQLRDAGIAVSVIGKRFKADPTALVRLTKALKEKQLDIVHTWLFAANSFGRVAARFARVPIVMASERCVDPWKRWWHFAIDRQLAKRTNAITTNSVGVQEFYASHGVPRELFHVIPNGVPGKGESTLSREEACRIFGVNTDRKVILAVGRLWPQKRYRDLIWTGELLGAARTDTTLLIIGDGPQKDELLRFRDSVTTPAHVAFLGARSDVANLLPHASLFWIGSEYEGQSNAVTEAMLSGVPVVASDIPGNRDLVIHDDTGRLFPLGDRAALGKESMDLLENPDQAERLAQSAKSKIQMKFSVEQFVSRHVELYRRLRANHLG
ncbi:MAG: glycosyltransferase [Planctomycetota bacterium]